jgi:hypothetical protein
MFGESPLYAQQSAQRAGEEMYIQGRKEELCNRVWFSMQSVLL